MGSTSVWGRPYVPSATCQAPGHRHFLFLQATAEQKGDAFLAPVFRMLLVRVQGVFLTLVHSIHDPGVSYFRQGSFFFWGGGGGHGLHVGVQPETYDQCKIPGRCITGRDQLHFKKNGNDQVGFRNSNKIPSHC